MKQVEMIDTYGKKLIYVTACGRSGTTLLGFVLGCTPDVIDLGEINEYVRFDGRPNGFAPGTATYEFWDRVLNRLRSSYGDLNFDYLRRLHRRTDYHLFMLQRTIFGDGFRKEEANEQRKFIAALYQSIFDECEHEIVVDSSKYPSRLWHLSHLMPRESLYVIHLRRSAKDVIGAMRGSGQGRPKSFFEAAAYYYVIEAMIKTMRGNLAPSHWYGMDYETFVTEPAKSLIELGNNFQIDVQPAIKRILDKKPLKGGFIFNGNRMRLNENVVFKVKGA